MKSIRFRIVCQLMLKWNLFVFVLSANRCSNEIYSFSYCLPIDVQIKSIRFCIVIQQMFKCGFVCFRKSVKKVQSFSFEIL